MLELALVLYFFMKVLTYALTPLVTPELFLNFCFMPWVKKYKAPLFHSDTGINNEWLCVFVQRQEFHTTVSWSSKTFKKQLCA